MRALTIYQPWATLIMAEAKRYEFRGGSYLDPRKYRNGPVPGERIAIQASARKIKRAEVEDILDRLDSGETGLIIDLARPIVARAFDSPEIFPRSAVLGTAQILKPVPVVELFRGVVDSDRLDHTKWAWPLTAIIRFEPGVPDVRGHQGFWQWTPPR